MVLTRSARKRANPQAPAFDTATVNSTSGLDGADILSGHNDLSLVHNLDDFVWSHDEEPHAKRRKAILKAHPEVTKLMGHEPLTKWLCLMMITVQVSLAYLLREQALWGGTMLFWAVAYVVGATLTQSLFLGMHETSHNLAFKKFSHNRLFGMVINLPMVIPSFISFKGYHNEHHKLQGTDGIDTDIPTGFEAWLLQSFCGKLFFLFNQTWFYALRPIFMKHQQVTRYHLLNWVVQMSFNATLVYLWGWGSIFYLLASAHLAGSLHPMSSHFIAEHYVFTEGIETHSYYGPLNYLCFNVGYHNEHHDFPLVAWSALPKLKALAPEFYDHLPYHKSWVYVLYHFLFNPQINLYNRIKRKAKSPANKVSATKTL